MTTQVVSIETKVEDADFMKYMMRKAAQQGKMRGTFIEAGYHLTTSPKVLIHVLNVQNKYINECQPIAVLGITEAAMGKDITIGGEVKPVRDYLKEIFKLRSIEKTGQTGHLGKWFFITTKDNQVMVRRKIDRQLKGIFSGILEDHEKVPGFEFPRRNNAPTFNEDHEDYLEYVEQQLGFKTVDVETSEVKVVEQVRRKKWKGDYGIMQVDQSPGKKSRKSYAGVTANKLDKPQDQDVQDKVHEEKSRSEKLSYKERSVILDAEIDKKLESHMTNVEEMLLEQREESNKRLEGMVGNLKTIMKVQAKDLNMTLEKEIQQVYVRIGEHHKQMTEKLERAERDRQKLYAMLEKALTKTEEVCNGHQENTQQREMRTYEGNTKAYTQRGEEKKELTEQENLVEDIRRETQSKDDQAQDQVF